MSFDRFRHIIVREEGLEGTCPRCGTLMIEHAPETIARNIKDETVRSVYTSNLFNINWLYCDTCNVYRLSNNEHKQGTE